MRRDAKIYVAGGNGLVGSALIRGLWREGYSNILSPSRSQLDLTAQADVASFMKREKPDYSFVAAALVGGIQANSDFPADFLFENVMIATNVINGAHLAGVDRLMFFGSSCVYPRDCPQPIREEYLLTGPLERTNEAYAVAKIAGIKLCESYRRQHGRRYLSVMPTNLYGPNDNYDLASSHVLPALIRKFHLAKLAFQGRVDRISADERRYGPIDDGTLATLGLRRGLDGKLAGVPGAPRAAVRVWGTGSPRREFLHVDDLARGCIALMGSDPAESLLNVGCGEDVSIGELAELVRRAVGFEGDVAFDASKPDGTPRKLLDVSRVSAYGWAPTLGLEDGIKRTYIEYCGKTGE